MLCVRLLCAFSFVQSITCKVLTALLGNCEVLSSRLPNWQERPGREGCCCPDLSLVCLKKIPLIIPWCALGQAGSVLTQVSLRLMAEELASTVITRDSEFCERSCTCWFLPPTIDWQHPGLDQIKTAARSSASGGWRSAQALRIS